MTTPHLDPQPAPANHDEAQEEAPPFLGTWRNVYILLVVELLTIAALLYAARIWLS